MTPPPINHLNGMESTYPQCLSSVSARPNCTATIQSCMIVPTSGALVHADWPWIEPRGSTCRLECGLSVCYAVHAFTGLPRPSQTEANEGARADTHMHNHVPWMPYSWAATKHMASSKLPPPTPSGSPAPHWPHVLCHHTPHCPANHDHTMLSCYALQTRTRPTYHGAHHQPFPFAM